MPSQLNQLKVKRIFDLFDANRDGRLAKVGAAVTSNDRCCQDMAKSQACVHVLPFPLWFCGFHCIPCAYSHIGSAHCRMSWPPSLSESTQQCSFPLIRLTPSSWRCVFHSNAVPGKPVRDRAEEALTPDASNGADPAALCRGTLPCHAALSCFPGRPSVNTRWAGARHSSGLLLSRSPHAGVRPGRRCPSDPTLAAGL